MLGRSKSPFEKWVFGTFHLSRHFGVTQYWETIHQNMFYYSDVGEKGAVTKKSGMILLG